MRIHTIFKPSRFTLIISMLLALSTAVLSLNSSAQEIKIAKAAAATDNTTSAQEATKNANVAEGQRLNGAADAPAPGKNAAKEKMAAKETADVVNKVPGVNVKPEDLQAPAEPAPIKGFHPIKKLLRPVENLEGMSIKLEQQIMKLEGPIAALQPPMIGLQKRMSSVDGHMTNVDGEINGMHTQLSGVQSQMVGVRSDLKTMRAEMSELSSPIKSLQKPLSGVAKPLETLQMQLNFILLAILIAAVSIAVGTPVAAILVYRHRRKLFPDMKDHELPLGRADATTSARR